MVSLAYADDTETALLQGIDLFNEGKYEEAQDLLKPLAKENAEAAFYLGRGYLQLNDIKPAVKWLKKAVKLDESQPQYYYWLGNACGVRAQNASIFKVPGYAKAVKKNFEKVLELDPDHLDARFGLVQFYVQAPGIVGGDKDKARLHAEEIKKRDAALGHQAFGMVYQAEEEYDKAEQEYLAAIEEQPDSVEVRYFLGFFYQQTEQGEKAVETFSNIYERHPDELDALYQVGRTGAFLGVHLDEAAEALLLYLVSEPGSDNPSIAWAHYRLGMVYEHAALPDSAKIHYQAALESNPDHKEAKKALKKLK
jgi:tetratricopeptide (TPR) repeat protein